MTKVLRTSTPHLLAVVAVVATAITFDTSYAQSDDLIAVSAENSGRSVDSSIYGDKFKEAERALLEGLSGDEVAPIQQVSAVTGGPKSKPISEQSESLNTGTVKAPVQTAPEGKLAQPSKVISAKAPVAEKKATPPSGAVAVLQGKLTTSELRVRELEQQLSEAKSQLSAAEVEINRLSGIISGGSRARLVTRSIESSGRTVPSAPSAEFSVKTQRLSSPADQDSQRIIPDVAPPAPSENLQVATVAVEKAELRLGPGKNHSALMTIPRGSRLAVEVRQGEWYRVFAPSGERAWIHSSLVRFGEGAASMNDGSSVKVHGYELSAEQQAFRRAGALTSGK